MGQLCAYVEHGKVRVNRKGEGKGDRKSRSREGGRVEMLWPVPTRVMPWRSKLDPQTSSQASTRIKPSTTFSTTNQHFSRFRFNVSYAACLESRAMAPEYISSNVMNFLVWRYLNEAGTPPYSRVAIPITDSS